MSKFKIANIEYDISDLSVLKNFKPENLKLKPYPHIVIKNAVNNELYKVLEQFYPNDDIVFNLDNQKHNKMYHNTRYQINAIDSLRSNHIHPIWKMFIDYHSSPSFLREVINVFGEERFNNFQNIINKCNEKKVNHFKNLTLGKRIPGNEKYSDIVLDCQVGINSPCIEKSHVKGPHIDNLNEVYAGLLYMKQDQDNGKGGNLEIYDSKIKYDNLNEFKKHMKFLPNEKILLNNRLYHRKQEFNPNELEKINEITYDKNTFVMFLCDINSIHGVSPRETNNISRRLVNIIGESYCKENNKRFN